MSDKNMTNNPPYSIFACPKVFLCFFGFDGIGIEHMKVEIITDVVDTTLKSFVSVNIDDVHSLTSWIAIIATLINCFFLNCSPNFVNKMICLDV